MNVKISNKRPNSQINIESQHLGNLCNCRIRYFGLHDRGLDTCGNANSNNQCLTKDDRIVLSNVSLVFQISD